MIQITAAARQALIARESNEEEIAALLDELDRRIFATLRTIRRWTSDVRRRSMLGGDSGGDE